MNMCRCSMYARCSKAMLQHSQDTRMNITQEECLSIISPSLFSVFIWLSRFQSWSSICASSNTDIEAPSSFLFNNQQQVYQIKHQITPDILAVICSNHSSHLCKQVPYSPLKACGILIFRYTFSSKEITNIYLVQFWKHPDILKSLSALTN